MKRREDTKIKQMKREKERLQEIMLSEDIKLYSMAQRVEMVIKYNNLSKRILEYGGWKEICDLT